MLPERWPKILAATTLFAFVLCAAARTAPQELKLPPEPKQVERRDGVFRVGPGARIVLGAAHAREDRTVGEMLAEKIQVATGRKIGVTTTASLPSVPRVIYPARVGDHRHLRDATTRLRAAYAEP